MKILDRVQELSLDFAKVAELTDQQTEAPKAHLQSLAEIGYYKFVADAEPGPRRRALDFLSAGCGATSFLATQHEGVCRRLFQARHPLLDSATSGEKFFGVCFAHLRRDPSPVDAIEMGKQVIFSGSGPWFSGFGVMDYCMVGGATEGQQLLMGISPMDSPEIHSHEPVPLAVMNATATVALDFNALAVSKSDIIVNCSKEELQEKDKFSTVFQAARSLGAARASARFLSDSAKEQVAITLEDSHREMENWDLEPRWNTAIAIRKKALELADQVLRAAFVQVGGRAHSLQHPLQRISREARFYSTTQLTGRLRSAVVNELSENGHK